MLFQRFFMKHKVSWISWSFHNSRHLPWIYAQSGRIAGITPRVARHFILHLWSL